MNTTPGFPDIKEDEQASRLTSLEKVYPIKVLEDFFTCTTFEETRTDLREWLMASFKANDDKQLRYIHLWQQLERLIEASLLLYEQDKSREDHIAE